MTDTITPAKPAKKAPAKPRTAPKPSVGSVWEIKTKGVAEVTRPDGATHLVPSVDGVALFVLDAPGEFTAKIAERGPIKVEAV